MYPDLFIHVTGARKEIAMSDSYRRLVNNAREYIEINIEPSLSAAREQAITSEIKKEINELSDSVAEADEKAQALDEELAELDEEYEKEFPRPTDFEECLKWEYTRQFYTNGTVMRERVLVPYTEDILEKVT